MRHSGPAVLACGLDPRALIKGSKVETIRRAPKRSADQYLIPGRRRARQYIKAPTAADPGVPAGTLHAIAARVPAETLTAATPSLGRMATAGLARSAAPIRATTVKR